ncbi:MAG: hypothetical protein EXS05_06320 [Planctomycetaceae bacterium]|nr:hypothetical protein [Planctomycetaceae bacterium]
MADRTAFLETVREAAAKGRGYRAAVNPLATHTAAWVGGGADPVATLMAEWIAVGGQAARVRGDQAAREWVRALVVKHQTQSAICWRHPLLERLELEAVLRDNNVAVATWGELAQQPEQQRWPTAFAAQLGITSVDWAVAETGTLALCARPDQGRVVSLLPPMSLAIVEPAQIVPDLFDLFERLETGKLELPSNITLVTGPSKTGDIELKLTTGVHGPGEVHLLVVE